MPSRNGIPKIGKSDDNEVYDGLGRALEDLDNCIEKRSKLNESNYLELCLQTEINSIIFNVMDTNEENTFVENQDENETNRSEMPDEKSSSSENHQRRKRHVRKRHIDETTAENVIVTHTNEKTVTKNGKNLDLIIDRLKQANPDVNGNSKPNIPIVKTYKSELNEREIAKTITSNPIKDVILEPMKPLNESKHEMLEVNNEANNSRRQNSGKSLKILLENVRNYFAGAKTNTTSEVKSNTIKSNNENGKDSVPDMTFIKTGNKTVENQTHLKEDTNKHKEKQLLQIHMPRTLDSTYNALKSLTNDFLRLQVVKYSLDKLLEYSRSVKNYGISNILWNLLTRGFTMTTRARGKKDQKGHAVLLSALLLLGVLVPMVFTAVAVMAKKALISSLVALALSIYAVTHSKGAGIQAKQTYEVDGLQAQSKYNDNKFNPPPSPNTEYPSVPNLPYSFPYDHTKYFNTRPNKQQESETMNYKNIAPSDQNNGYRAPTKPNYEYDTKPQNDYEYPPEPKPNQYEVTEQTDVKFRRPIRDRYKPLDQENYNTNAMTESYRPSTYEDEHYEEGKRPSQDIRHGKENTYRGRDPTKKTPKYGNRSNYKNSDSYRTESNKRYKGSNNDDELERYRTSERNLNKNAYSSKFTDSSKEESVSHDYTMDKHTTEFETSMATDNIYKVEPPPTERTVYSQIISTESIVYDSMNSEDVFKPIIVTTQAPKNLKTSLMQQTKHSKEEHSSEKGKPRPNTNTDDLLYQNLDEHEFKRPNPVYKPNDKGNDGKSTKSGLTLAYVPKIRTSSSSNNSTETYR
ncbi:hypothetical protein M8J76_016167 [Diaphorina citri]|nr:hypothetical protein M8J76_016167 [Diaphorina citri]